MGSLYTNTQRHNINYLYIYKIFVMQVKTDWAIVKFLIYYQNLTRENIHDNRLFANTNLFLTLSIYIITAHETKIKLYTYICTMYIQYNAKSGFAIGM